MPKVIVPDPIIEVQNVSFSYGQNEVLRDITFTVSRGEYLGIIGPNGAGKTTLLKIILGLLPPSQGAVNLLGKEMRNFKEWSKIGYVPQKVTNFDPRFPASVMEVVLMGRYGRRGLFRPTTSHDRRIAEKALRQVGMEDYKDRLIGALSGGQQQRVFIARALATEPEVIFLDEPTVGIDQKTFEDFYALLKKMNKELHLTLILISHDIEMITREVAYIAYIDTTLKSYSAPKEFLKNTELRKSVETNIAHHHRHE